MTEESWLIDETKPLDAKTIRELTRELPIDPREAMRGAQKVPNLAIRVHDIIIHDTKKWFGEADIRMDALVIHGHGSKDKPESFYAPRTFRFSRVSNGDRLPIGDEGLLIYYGKPLHFLDIFITVSRDRGDSDDLSKLLPEQLQSTEVQGAIGALLGLATVAPPVAVVTSAVGAAATIGRFAYQVLRKATGSTIGLYRTSYLQYRDRFGISPRRHPETGKYRVKDLSFWYEIVIDKPPDHK